LEGEAYFICLCRANSYANVVYSAAQIEITGVFNELRPEVIDLFNYYLFSYSLPCLIVAVAISYATNREVVNAP